MYSARRSRSAKNAAVHNAADVEAMDKIVQIGRHAGIADGNKELAQLFLVPQPLQGPPDPGHGLVVQVKGFCLQVDHGASSFWKQPLSVCGKEAGNVSLTAGTMRISFDGTVLAAGPRC